MGKGKRMAGLFLMATLLFCQVIVASASTKGAWQEGFGNPDAYAYREYYHFDFTEKQEAENEPKSESVPKSEDVPNPGFWIGLDTTAVGGMIAAVIIAKKKSEDEK